MRRQSNPHVLDWIKVPPENRKETLSNQLPRKEASKRQADAPKKQRNKAFMWTLYQAGARIGELSDLTDGGVECRKHRKTVLIDVKPGAR